MARTPEDDLDKIVGKSFEALLLEDVILATDRLAEHNNQSSRRDYVRTVFSAIDGVTWTCRMFVRSVLASNEELDALADLALRDTGYQVSYNGSISEQPRFHALPVAIRLIVNQAQLIAPDLKVDYNAAGWSHLKSAISIRNRITHPKFITDLQITNDDTNAVTKALHWVMETTELIMTSINASMRDYNEAMKTLLEALKRGDPDVVAAYERAVASLKSENE